MGYMLIAERRIRTDIKPEHKQFKLKDFLTPASLAVMQAVVA